MLGTRHEVLTQTKRASVSVAKNIDMQKTPEGLISRCMRRHTIKSPVILRSPFQPHFFPIGEKPQRLAPRFPKNALSSTWMIVALNLMAPRWSIPMDSRNCGERWRKTSSLSMKRICPIWKEKRFPLRGLRKFSPCLPQNVIRYGQRSLPRRAPLRKTYWKC